MVDDRLRRRALEEKLGLADQILIQRAGGGDENGERGVGGAPGPAHLLPGAGDCARIAAQHRRFQLADVDA
ncbi:MAG: hypothetical protein ACO3IP_07425, partial [Burkholderiaceae bacterium]